MALWLWRKGKKTIMLLEDQETTFVQSSSVHDRRRRDQAPNNPIGMARRNSLLGHPLYSIYMHEEVRTN